MGGNGLRDVGGNHERTAVDDVVGEADALVADGFGLDAVVAHGEVKDVVSVIQCREEFAITLGDGLTVIVDINTVLLFAKMVVVVMALACVYMENSVESQQYGMI